jgi:hypothetical protein
MSGAARPLGHGAGGRACGRLNRVGDKAADRIQQIQSMGRRMEPPCPRAVTDRPYRGTTALPSTVRLDMFRFGCCGPPTIPKATGGSFLQGTPSPTTGGVPHLSGHFRTLGS